MRVLYLGQIGILSVSFRGGRKTGEPGEKPSEQGENQQHSLTQCTYGTEPESNLGHIVAAGEHSYHCTIPAPHNLHVHDVCT